MATMNWPDHRRLPTRRCHRQRDHGAARLGARRTKIPISARRKSRPGRTTRNVARPGRILNGTSVVAFRMAPWVETVPSVGEGRRVNGLNRDAIGAPGCLRHCIRRPGRRPHGDIDRLTRNDPAREAKCRGLMQCVGGGIMRRSDRDEQVVAIRTIYKIGHRRCIWRQLRNGRLPLAQFLCRRGTCPEQRGAGESGNQEAVGYKVVHVLEPFVVAADFRARSHHGGLDRRSLRLPEFPSGPSQWKSADSVAVTIEGSLECLFKGFYITRYEICCQARGWASPGVQPGCGARPCDPDLLGKGL